MVNKRQSCSSSKDETTKPITPTKTGDGHWEDETHGYDEVDIPPMLPPDDFALAQIGNISNTRLSSGLQNHPTNVRPPEALVGIVGIKFSVGVAMVSTMSSRPPSNGTFYRASASEGKEIFKRLGGIVRSMGPKTVVTRSDTYLEKCQNMFRNGVRNDEKTIGRLNAWIPCHRRAYSALCLDRDVFDQKVFFRSRATRRKQVSKFKNTILTQTGEEIV